MRNNESHCLALKTYPREAQLVSYSASVILTKSAMAASTTKHETIGFAYPFDLASCTRIIGMGMAMECTLALTQVYVTIRMDDAFTLNCHPTVPGCEESKSLCTEILTRLSARGYDAIIRSYS